MALELVSVIGGKYGITKDCIKSTPTMDGGAYLLFDGKRNSINAWGTRVGNDVWFQIDLLKSYLITKIELTEGGIGALGEHEGLKSAYIKGSNDGINFENIQRINLLDLPMQVQSFNLNTTTEYRYIRVCPIEAHNRFALVQECSLYANISINKFLINHGSQLHTFNGTGIVQVSSQTLDEDNFKSNGIDDITTITEEEWNKTFPNKEDVKILMWTDDTEKQEAKMTYECEPFELIDWLKQDERKLLVYTDDLEKKECNMVYNCESYKPIDRLKETGDICKVIIKNI